MRLFHPSTAAPGGSKKQCVEILFIIIFFYLICFNKVIFIIFGDYGDFVTLK